MSLNSYPKQVRNTLQKRLNSNINKTKGQTVDDRKKIWLNLPYLGDKGDHLTKSLIRKLNKCFNENVKFIKVIRPINLECFAVTIIIFSFNRKLMLFIELCVQVVTISTWKKLTEIL